MSATDPCRKMERVASASLHLRLTNEYPAQEINNIQTKGTYKLFESKARICFFPCSSFWSQAGEQQIMI